MVRTKAGQNADLRENEKADQGRHSLQEYMTVGVKEELAWTGVIRREPIRQAV
jgi:hypothetical protein